MKEHILFIIDGLPGGGAENVTLRLASGLNKSGYQISLLSLNTQLDYIIPEGIHYIVSADNYQGPLRKLKEISRRAKKMDKVLLELFQQKGKPALVVSNLHKTDRIVVKSKTLKECNVWHCIHGIFSQSYLSNKSGLSYWIKKEKIKKVYENRKLVCVSNAVGDDLLKNISIQPQKLKTIYNPFDFTEIREKASETNPYHGLDYILHVGRFHQVKRQDRLIDAFAKANIPCKLLIVGQGTKTMEEQLKMKIHEHRLDDKVILAGFHANPHPIINDAKAVVISSDSEGLPTVLIEALICHTPVVSTDCPGGVREIMTGELGQYLSALDPDALAKKIQLVYDSPPLITDDMYDKFDARYIQKQYLELIEE
ncbi:glycosyl transferase, group 1 family protein [Xenorhabdus mauleonii]|uniref:Glycosyl transferase, group 1 family protein n=1 Tax=Xenorhabdus mauleonii TaxID=351675 RepID=A0A1I3TVE2_9GAMM|nr:glycosyltransferase [Xenorhabdus mauleonii]PHM39590.1 glycosyl transferase, group 1 family protein [Xenorhabdus mauleonii]SFJ74602.1 Glycosyltransferase involved in cell wall bisynthesis [Xenorhabdus mauleonii]